MKIVNFKLTIFFIMFLLRIVFLYSYIHDWKWISGYKALGWTTGYLLYLIYVIVMYGILGSYIYKKVTDKKLKIFSVMFLIMVVYVWISLYSPTFILPVPTVVTNIFYLSYVVIMFGMLLLFLAGEIRKQFQTNFGDFCDKKR